MKIANNLMTFATFLLILFIQFFFIPLFSLKVKAATSPTLAGSNGYSVLGGAAVTNVGTTTTNGSVGVSPGTSITGGTINAGGGIHSNDASAIAAQGDALTAFGALDQGCDHSYASGQDLSLISPLVPGVYCSAGSFLLTGNLNLSGTGVWIFKTVSTLVTSPGSSVTGGDPCNVWWRIGSSTTLDTTTSFIGTVISQNGVNAMNTGGTLNGRFLALSAGTVTLQGNTISGPSCSVESTPTPTPGEPTSTPTSTPTPTPTPSSLSSSLSSSGGSTSAPAAKVCPVLECVTPIVIESKRVDANSIFISWGPYAGINTFSILYGLENGKWLYSTTVTGFSTTIHALPSNQPIWVLIAPADNCSIGPCGVATFVGGPTLPNTGLAPSQTTIPWYTRILVFIRNIHI